MSRHSMTRCRCPEGNSGSRSEASRFEERCRCATLWLAMPARPRSGAASAGPHLSSGPPPVHAPDSGDPDEATRVLPGFAQAHGLWPPGVAQPRGYFSGLRRIDNAVLTTALATVFAAVTESIRLERMGVGVSGPLDAAQFLAAAGLLVVPFGALFGLAVYAFARLISSERIATFRRTVNAPVVYGAGLALPFVLGACFWVHKLASAAFQSES